MGGRWDCFGIELGYDWCQRRKREFSFNAGDSFFNFPIAGTGVSGNARVELQGGHIDLQGYMPVVDCIELIGVVGIGYVQPRVSIFGRSFFLRRLSQINFNSGRAKVILWVDFVLVEVI